MMAHIGVVLLRVESGVTFANGERSAAEAPSRVQARATAGVRYLLLESVTGLMATDGIAAIL